LELFEPDNKIPSMHVLQQRKHQLLYTGWWCLLSNLNIYSAMIMVLDSWLW